MQINKIKNKLATKRIYVGRNGNYFKHGRHNVGINIHIQNAPKQVVRKRKRTRKPRMKIITGLHNQDYSDQILQIARMVQEFKELFQRKQPIKQQNVSSQTQSDFEMQYSPEEVQTLVPQLVDNLKPHEHEHEQTEIDEMQETGFQPTEIHSQLLQDRENDELLQETLLQEQEEQEERKNQVEQLPPPIPQKKSKKPKLTTEQLQKSREIGGLRKSISSLQKKITPSISQTQRQIYLQSIKEYQKLIKRLEGKGDKTCDNKGTTVEDFLKMIMSGIKGIKNYDIVFVKDKTMKVPVLNHDNQIFIFFRKLPNSDCYHYSVGVYQKEYPSEICLFDPLANEWVREQNHMFLARNITAISPEFMCKIKSNSNAWQDVSEHGFRKNDQSWCAEYCYLFLHHLLNLEQSYPEATEFNDKSDRPIIKRVLKFAEI